MFRGGVAKYVLWKAEERWKARGWGLSFGRVSDNEYVFRSMMWADNYWSFFHDREILVHMVNDIVEELTWNPSRNHDGGRVRTRRTRSRSRSAEEG